MAKEKVINLTKRKKKLSKKKKLLHKEKILKNKLKTKGNYLTIEVQIKDKLFKGSFLKSKEEKNRKKKLL